MACAPALRVGLPDALKHSCVVGQMTALLCDAHCRGTLRRDRELYSTLPDLLITAVVRDIKKRVLTLHIDDRIQDP